MAAHPAAAQVPASSTAAAPGRLNTTGRVVELVVPLRERVPLGQVAIQIGTDDVVRVSVADVANAVSRSLRPEFLTGLRAVAEPDGYATLERIASAGLQLNFDPTALELIAQVNAEDRNVQTLGLGFSTGGTPPEPDRSEPFAAALAWRASLDYEHEGFETGLQEPRVDFRLNGRAFGLGFENEFGYDGQNERGFYRFGSRLLYDRPDWAMRFTAGDILPNPVSFQSTLDVLGVGAARLLRTFRSDRILTASSGRTVTLREAANVTVVVNGVPSRVLRLQAGVYDLTDLPLTTGANAVQLIVEDDAGGRRVVSFDFFQDFELLAPGVDEFDVRVGVRSDFESGTRRYELDEPAVSGFYRRGLTSQLTAGANLQATTRAQQFGLEGTLGSPIGLFTLEGAVSNIDGFDLGTAVRLQYRYSSPLQQLQGERRVDALIEYRSADFGGPGQNRPTGSTDLRAALRYNQPISRVLNANIGVDYASRPRGRRDRYGVQAGIGYQFSPNGYVNLFTGYERPGGVAFGLSAVYRFGRSSTVSAQYDTFSDQASLNYIYSPTRVLDAFSGSAQLTRSRDDIAFSGNLGYRTNRGDFELAHRAAYGTGANEIVSQTTSLRHSGTFAFAGGRFALGRYLSDAFAIVSAHPTLRGAQVRIGSRIGEDAPDDRAEDAVIARTGTLGPALVPLSSYSRQNIFFDVPDAPVGYDLGAGNFAVYPWLHSGFDLTVGSEFNLSVVGTLLDERGEPLALVAGTARRVGDANSPTVEIFTNRAGRLAGTGFAPGRWRIAAGGRVYIVAVAPSANNLVNLGSIAPTAREENAQ